MVGGGEDGEGCEEPLEERVAYLEDTPGLLCARCHCWQDTGTILGRDGAPVNSIMVTFAITVAILAELALKQFTLH
jgi:hypothetical protein